MIHLLLAIIYCSFISLGLPDALLGAAWPAMYGELAVPVSQSGLIFFIIAAGTVCSSLQSDRLSRRLSPGWITVLSTAATALALLGFSTSHSFWQLCLWAIPYGLGAGSVDAALNNYVALHFASRHMSWLHCMWGLGASIGPAVMGAALTAGAGWRMGYRTVSWFQLGLTALLLLSLPLWKLHREAAQHQPKGAALRLSEIFRIPGVKAVCASFFCYCALEQTTGLWASSYLVLHRGLAPEVAAAFAGYYYIGITVGRALTGFLTFRLSDDQLIRLGQATAALGIGLLMLPLGQPSALAGLVLLGLGCAPIYPCVIHATPARFGPDRSQAIIGVQMASAYVGNCCMPPLFGLLAARLSPALLPLFLLGILSVMAGTHSLLLRQTRTS